MQTKLKPNTTYRFSESDLQFVLELAKCGHVHMLSSQVTLAHLERNSSTPGITFKDYGGGENNKCEGLKLPDNWVIEGIYTGEGYIKITFGVTEVKK